MANSWMDGGTWRGFHIRYLAILSVSFAVLQAVAYYTVHYPLMFSSEFAMILMMWLIIPRLTERRLANTFAGVTTTFLLGLILQFTIGLEITEKGGIWYTLGQNLLIFVVALALSYLYLRVSIWSDRKKAELEKRRAEKSSSAQTTVAPVRVHRIKKRRHPGRRKK
ncbi:hypothetical protein ACOJUR_10555 [Alicyclobacillus tolerans]|uniref:Uncharacterized protein n=2 Tax=Alicyclobacillus tolerans TaxID=90970 RepID=A0A1M6UR20_9BACL|nr:MULTISPECIES: hypothetical protein [Alicyclobacillus]MDP9728791.1 hypothetical protein [Alicyclobacillus tengchongensis]QRF23202.1 hypothetical protein FY534_05595 [Alicyclobacillus sp. TC]SHK71611.1 hypothetical protein SAMN05443507_12071 [Alicyclobacillus montanus]